MSLVEHYYGHMTAFPFSRHITTSHMTSHINIITSSLPLVTGNTSGDFCSPHSKFYKVKYKQTFYSANLQKYCTFSFKSDLHLLTRKEEIFVTDRSDRSGEK